MHVTGQGEGTCGGKVTSDFCLLRFMKSIGMLFSSSLRSLNHLPVDLTCD